MSKSPILKIHNINKREEGVRGGEGEKRGGSDTNPTAARKAPEKILAGMVTRSDTV